MSNMLSCVHEDFHALWKSYFVNARMISERRESLIIHPINDLVTWIFKAAIQGNRGLERIHSSNWHH